MRSKSDLRVKLPDDIEAYIKEVEARASKATPGPWHWLTSSNQMVSEQGLWLCTWSPIEADTAEFIANARNDVPVLCQIVQDQAQEIVNGKTWLDHVRSTLGVPESIGIVDHCASLTKKLQRAESERDEARARIAKLEDACRNVLTTEPPPPNEVYYAWSGCAQASEYQTWFHRQFNLNQVAELLEPKDERGKL